MMAVQGELGNSRQATPVQVFNSQLEPALIFAMAVGLAVIILGGYGLSWSWTGFKENNTLWDWLRLTVLPIVLGVTAFWLSAEGRRRVEWRWWWLILPVAAATVLLVGGYALHWDWTGFQGNKLWDWLHLLVLPLVLVLLPSSARLRTLHPSQWRFAVGAVIVFFVVVTIGGYTLHWTWTGMSDNEFWDWLDLLLVPFLVPVAFIFLRKRMEHRRAAALKAGRLDQGTDEHHLPRLAAHGWIGAPPVPIGEGGVAPVATVPSTRQAADSSPCPHCGRAG
jgi:uncharacterized membrane protein